MVRGVHRYWYRDHRLKWREITKTARKNGICRQWHENGQLKFRRIYKDGKLISEKEFSRGGSSK